MSQQFEIDDDVVELVRRLANPRPFEPFSGALRRVLQNSTDRVPKDIKHVELEMAAKHAAAKKVPSPSPTEWVATVPELKTKKGLNTWKAICDLLKIDTAGDSARRRLKNWVKANRASWPPVPDLD